MRGITLRAMRIAVVAPGWFPVPPVGYGGIELVVALLADGFVDAGHDVTLFARGGSRPRRSWSRRCPSRPTAASSGTPGTTRYHALSAYLQVDGFDVVHDHAGVIGPVCGAMLGGNPPVVHTLHGPWTDEARLLYDLVGRHVHLVAISDAQAAENRDVKYAGIVHNGIDLDAYPYRADKDEYLVYIGRANPDKGPVEAIRIARQAGRPLKMILKRGEPPELAYFEHEIEPLLGHDIELFENVTHEEKVELLGRRARHAVPDPVAGAVRPRHGRGDGVRHAGRDDELGRGARARRRRRHRVPARQRRRPRDAIGLRRRPRPGGLPGPGRGALLGRGHGPRLRGRLRQLADGPEKSGSGISPTA